MSNQRHNDKKEVVLKSKQSNRNPLIFAVVLALVATAGAAAYFVADTTATPTSATLTGNGPAAAVRYPVSLFSDGVARHFEHQADGLTIRYFIIQSADGVIRAAFDACDVCWPAGKGYYQEGDQMVCRNCGRRFDSVLVNEVKGGCNPAPLRRNVQGDELVLQVTDIREGANYFNFKDRAKS